MKKLLIALLFASLLLTSCRVGPKEGADDIITGDAGALTVPVPLPDEPDLPSPAEPVQTDTLPVAADPEPDLPVESDTPPYDPEPEEDITEEDLPDDLPEIPDISDAGFDVEIFDTPIVLYSTATLNVREGPSTDYDSMGYLDKGEEVYAFAVSDAGWYAILFEDGYGFVSGSYMSDEPEEE